MTLALRPLQKTPYFCWHSTFAKGFFPLLTLDPLCFRSPTASQPIQISGQGLVFLLPIGTRINLYYLLTHLHILKVKSLAQSNLTLCCWNKTPLPPLSIGASQLPGPICPHWVQIIHSDLLLAVQKVQKIHCAENNSLWLIVGSAKSTRRGINCSKRIYCWLWQKVHTDISAVE